VVLERRVDHQDAARLLRAFFDEQVDRYGFAESIDLNPAGYEVWLETVDVQGGLVWHLGRTSCPGDGLWAC
jgi:hypothetical protein